MNRVPIAFAFDNNLVMPACVCISSLMMNAREDTFYDIFILHSGLDAMDFKQLDMLSQHYSNCKINYREVGEIFDAAYEVRNVTTPTYYRLLIPELITEYAKILYADVDMIFRMDLSDVYNIDMGNNYLAATYDLGMNLGKAGQKYIDSVQGLVQGEYLQAGFILLNAKLMNEDGIVAKFKAEARKKYKFQDQDILNIVCRGRKMVIPWKYNMTDYSFSYLMNEPFLLTNKYANSDVEEAKRCGNLHYNGHKPWKKYSVNFDIWWEYYRKSPFFDEKFYFDFYYNRLNELDQLSLWKRIKVLCRYFVYGKRKI